MNARQYSTKICFFQELTFLRFRFRSDFDSSSDDGSTFLDFISTLRIVVASFFNISDVSLSICSLSSLDSLLLDLLDSRSFWPSRSLCLDRDLRLLFGLLDLVRSRSRSRLSRRLLYINWNKLMIRVIHAFLNSVKGICSPTS